MKLLRPLLVAAGVVLAVLVIAAAVVLTPSFQTWLVHRELAQRPQLHLTVGHVAATPGRVMAFDVAYEHNGVRVTIPRATADLSLISAVCSRQVYISRLSAEDCVVDASTAQLPSATPVASPSNGTATSAKSEPSGAVITGVLAQLDLPFDFGAADVNLGATVRLPHALGTARVHLNGGGLYAGHDGHFEVSADASLPGATVKAVQAKGQLVVAMNSPRTVDHVTATMAATADEPASSPLTVEIDATRNSAGETYGFVLRKTERQLLVLHAQLPNPGRYLSGTWKLDLHDSDLARFALGRPLPTFAGGGEGTVDTDVGFTATHVVGRIDASVSRLEALGEKLAGIGAIRTTADIDLWQRHGALSVAKMTVAVYEPESGTPAGAVHPGTGRLVANLRALQAFDFNPRTGDLRASDPASDLIGVALQGMPLAWAKPFLPMVVLSGGDVRGQVVATPRAGGFTAHTVSPVAIRQLSVSYAGKPTLRDLDVSLNGSGDYTPAGWQAELTGMTAKAGQSTVLLLDAKAGQLAGADQPVKATGLISADLAMLVAQPALGGTIPLQKGEGTVEFAASFGATKQVEAKVNFKHLVADPKVTTDSVPDVSGTVRADVAADGSIALNVPIVLVRDGRQSDLTFIGSFGPPHSGRGFQAQLASNHLVIDDAAPLAAVCRSSSLGQASRGPFWSTLDGTVALQLKQVVYTGTAEVKNLVGQVTIKGGTFNFENVRAAVGDTGDGLLNGRIGFDATRNQYSAEGHVVLVDFNPSILLRTVYERQPPLIDGKFGLSSDVVAHADSLDALLPVASGSFELTSRSGVFRGLDVTVGNLVENSSKLRTWLASAGSAIVGLAGRKEDYDEITSRSQAANELAKALSAIAYDQLNVLLTRDEALNSTVKQVALISPEFRLTGSGEMRHAPMGRSVLDDQVSLELQLRARGRPAELMKYLGVLDAKPDDLGYSACTIPIKVSGTVASLDTREFSNRLIALAVDKNGFLERAGARALDWINRLRGKG